MGCNNQIKKTQSQYSFESGGIPGVISSTGQPIEMEDGEIILTRRVAVDPAGLAAAPDLNARYGGVIFFETGGPVSPVSGDQ